METGKNEERTRPAVRDKLEKLPAELAAECQAISEEIRKERDEVREAKIIAARIRIDSDYYDSDNVLRIVASRLLDESLPT